jgi:hypothetical protein
MQKNQYYHLSLEHELFRTEIIYEHMTINFLTLIKCNLYIYILCAIKFRASIHHDIILSVENAEGE